MILQFILQAITEIVVPGCDLFFASQHNEQTKRTRHTGRENDSYEQFLVEFNKHGNRLYSGDDWWPILDNVNGLLYACWIPGAWNL